MPGVVRHGYNMALPLLRGAHAARIYSRRLQWLTTPKLFWSLYYNQVTYAMIKSPILWTTYLYYNQVTHTIVKLLTTSREVNEARWPHTCRPCAFEKKKTGKFRPTQNTQRNPQQPDHRVQLETACDEIRPMRWPILSRFHRFRVFGNRPRTALAISKNDECYTHAHTYRQTN